LEAEGVKLNSSMIRPTITVALVIVIGGLFTWRELLDDDGADSLLGIAEQSLKVEMEVGQPVPDFTLETLGGELVSLSSFRGQVVVLNFWATWCTPCREEMTEFQALWEEHDPQGNLMLLAVNLQESTDSVAAFVDEFGLTFPIALDSDGDVLDKYGLPGLPGTFFIDEAGILQARVLGPLDADRLRAGVERAEGDS
jgi:peroxiredoxin